MFIERLLGDLVGFTGIYWNLHVYSDWVGFTVIYCELVIV